MVLETSKEGAEDKGGETGNQTKQANYPQPSGSRESDDGTKGGKQDGTRTKKAKFPASSTPKTTVITPREQLGRLGLSTKGIEAEHMSRLRRHEEKDDTDEGGDANKVVDKEGNGDTDGNEVDKEDEIDKEGSDVTLDSSRHEETSEEEGEAARGVERNDARTRRRRTVRMERRERNMPSLFTIKDVEGSISHFSGDDKLLVKKWIDEFEDMSGLLQWDNLQRAIYAKRLLKGSAKQYIALQKELTTWKSMKKSLLKEFENKVNSAMVHLQLSKRKRQANETPRQDVYAMNTIASQGDVEKEAVMQYVIDGIQDDEAAKSILYTKCDGREKTTDGNVRSVNVVTHSSTDDEITVELDNVKIQAMIDTGTDYTLLRRSEYQKIGSPPLRETLNTFEGFGSTRVKLDGVFRATVTIQGEDYDGDIFVIPDYAMSHLMLAGKKITRQMKVVIRGGLITITKLHTNKSRDDGLERKEIAAEETDDVFRELRLVNLIETRSVDVNDRYREEIILDKQIDEWLKEGVIQPSKSKYSSPVVIVQKKNNEYRVCVDYRQLNKKIARDRFPMPLIDDRIDALADARVFSVLDLKNGFFHVPVTLESRKYTSFVTPDGQYKFVKTPFGLCKSPTFFLRFIDEVFRDLIRRNIVCTYFDDLIVPSKDEDEALANLKETLKVAAEKRLSINWKKCAFLKRRVDYLGHIIAGGTVGPSPSKVKAVKSFPKPTSKKAVQNFLCLTGYFRKFVRDHSKIAKPLSELLKINQRFRFGAEKEEAFERLKQLLLSEPILRIYRPDATTELHTDASKEGYGAALLQKGEEDDHFYVVYFTSRKTSDAEKKRHSYELEALAVIHAVKKFRVYLLGIKFKLVTDCSALQKTLSKIDISPKVARSALMLEEFEYEVEHRVGTRLKHVDALSRYPVMTVQDRITPVIRKEQDNEERLHVIKKVLETEPYEDYSCENGILMKRV
ncbi:uncharacterized protein LOC124295072 [Neodiprion lecontei]|uniref:Uncharacterized protein LOC124295072 n=1 Tax=Neodiprion lecontei TaxID=441921 RepID=A0ABM3GG64_NEOLC|nr:uncharacterized protein LOC124295072 [Neodiprion lecontei]